MPLEVSQKITVGDIDKDGDVYIEMQTSFCSDAYCYLNRSEIRQLMEFLKEQLEK